MKLDGKTMLITGASQGIGRFLAVYFAKRNVRLLLTARNQAGLAETCAMVERAGGTCWYGPCDLRARDTLERLIDGIRAAAGGVDLLLNNAADVTSKPFLESSLAEIDSLVRTNVTGCLQLTRLVVPLMLERGGGMVINMSSLAGYKPNAGQTVYSISKRAVNAASEALRAELRGKGIHVMNVALSSVAVDTPAGPGQVPVERLAHRLERAIALEATEVFLSPVTKWLMRLYRFWPALMYLR